jgi:hypothetical protein
MWRRLWDAISNEEVSKMGLIEKLKLLLKVKKPIGDVIDAAKEANKTKKWFSFVVTLVGTLATTAGALTGVIPPQAQLIAASVLQAIYNVIRGADKADQAEVKGTLRTTEFWLSGLTEVQKMFVALHTGGIDPVWMPTMTALVGAALAFGQNLAARAPAEPVK